MAEKPRVLCQFEECLYGDAERVIPGDRGLEPATKYHIDCAYRKRLKDNREGDKRTLLRKLDRK